MGKKKVFTIVFEKASDGSIWSRIEPDGIAVYGVGNTEEEAVESLKKGIQEVVSFCRDKGQDLPDWYSEDMRFVVRYDLAGFFEEFPFINVSEFAKAVHINPGLMRRYKSRSAFASAKQKARIQEGLDKLVGKLAAVRF